MWIVKTIGRRTKRGGTDPVYSVNGMVITPNLEEAVDTGIDVFREEISGTHEASLPHPRAVKTNQTSMHWLHTRADYWDGTWKPLELEDRGVERVYPGR